MGTPALKQQVRGVGFEMIMYELGKKNCTAAVRGIVNALSFTQSFQLMALIKRKHILLDQKDVGKSGTLLAETFRPTF
jgi:hypothetical protein